MLLQVVIFLVMIVGTVFALNVDVKERLLKLKNIRQLLEKLPKKEKHLTLKKRLEELRGQKKASFITRNVEEAQHVLAITGKAGKVNSTMTFCGVCAGIGFFLGLILRVPMLCPILTVGFYLVPLWIVKLSARNYRRHLGNELSTCLSIITASYVRNENIIAAIDENLINLHQPVKEPFAKFLARVKFVNPDVTSALVMLRDSIDDAIFYNWCSTLIQCQNDRSLKYSLQPLVQRFSQTKAIQAEVETELMKPFTNFLQMSALAPGLVPLFYFVNQEWFYYLTQSILGQAGMAFTAIAILMGINKSVNLTKPIEVMRGGENS